MRGMILLVAKQSRPTRGRAVSISRWCLGFISSIRYYFGKFEMLLGLLSLGTATGLLRLQAKKTGSSREAELTVRMLTAMLLGAVAVLLWKRGSNARRGVFPRRNN